MVQNVGKVQESGEPKESLQAAVEDLFVGNSGRCCYPLPRNFLVR
jgi:hypothetical protein